MASRLVRVLLKPTQHGVRSGIFLHSACETWLSHKENWRGTQGARTRCYRLVSIRSWDGNMAEAFVKPPEPLAISSGNPAHSWEKWKIRLEIYLQATGASTKPDVQKVGLFPNHIGDRGIEIYRNFHFAPPMPNLVEGLALTHFQAKIGMTMQLWWRNSTRILQSATHNSCCENDFGCIWRESLDRVSTRGSTLLGNVLTSASSPRNSTNRQSEVRLPSHVQKIIQN